jgi:hypothetical protein
MDNMAKGAPRMDPSLLSGNVDNRFGAVDRQATGDMSKVTVAVTNDTEAVGTSEIMRWVSRL